MYSLCLTAWAPRLATVTEPNVYEDEENLEEQYVVHNDSCATERKPFLYSNSSHRPSAGPSHPHTPPSKDALQSNFNSVALQLLHNFKKRTRMAANKIISS